MGVADWLCCTGVVCVFSNRTFPVHRFLFLLQHLLFVAVVTSAATAGPLDDLLIAADAATRAGDLVAVSRALRQAEQLEANNANVLWRLAKLHVDYAIREKAEDKQLAQVNRALGYANRAVAADSSHSMARVSLAMCYGQKALVVGAREKLELSLLIKRHAEDALALDAANDVAMIILAIWHREVASLNWFLKTAVKLAYGSMPEASLSTAKRLLERAIAMDQGNIMPRVELAKTLIEMEEESAAARELRTVLKMKVADAGDPARLAEARKLLEQIS